ncbi:hypothetical protein B5X24_HaOG217246 [Helicoverpa armigera]|uniref:Galectin n=1 Tax=Helicoverpa armigera TaxID=29058 RepID=A0A2W1C140_HELAM|nr:hypothetical protein B5X24_HaOG217246 [Helicoverpa armigera]
MISVYDPDLPCVHKIAVNITNGSKIRIQGSIPHDAHRFWIDFQCGLSMSTNVDVAFHLNPRFDHMAVVRNTLIDEEWGEEERTGGIPLSRGEDFDMLIVCDIRCWKVSINGQHFCEYNHRIEYDRITHLVVFGDVKIIKCNIVAPSQDPYDQTVQCVHKIPGGICSSSKIRIQGSIPHDAHRRPNAIAVRIRLYVSGVLSDSDGNPLASARDNPYENMYFSNDPNDPWD